MSNPKTEFFTSADKVFRHRRADGYLVDDRPSINAGDYGVALWVRLKSGALILVPRRRCWQGETNDVVLRIWPDSRKVPEPPGFPEDEAS